jgi:predicted transcriptional regulator
LHVGIDEAEFESIVLESALAGEFYESDGRFRPERHIGSAWLFVEENDQESSPPEDIRDRLAALHLRIRSYKFPGKGGTTDRKIALEIVEWCHSVGTYSPLLSSRFLAERVGIGNKTAARGLQRLTDAGLLRHLGRGTSGAHHYRVDLDWLIPDDAPAVAHSDTSKETPGDSTTCVSLTNLDLEAKHPLFLPAALGPVAGRLYFEVPPDAVVTATGAAELVKISRSSADRALKRLVENGLFVRVDGYPAKYGNAGVSVDYLDNLACVYGTHDWGERKAQEHDRQRKGWELVQRQWNQDRDEAVAKSRAAAEARKPPEPPCEEDPCKNPFCQIHDRPPVVERRAPYLTGSAKDLSKWESFLEEEGMGMEKKRRVEMTR